MTTRSKLSSNTVLLEQHVQMSEGDSLFVPVVAQDRNDGRVLGADKLEELVTWFQRFSVPQLVS